MKSSIVPVPKFSTFFLTVALTSSVARLSAFEIVVDYSYDTNNFFNTPERREALEAVAARYSRVINSNLLGVSPSGTDTGTGEGWRLGFTHPGTGDTIQISTAADDKSDPLVARGLSGADVYGFEGLQKNQWILYAGGRALSSAGLGGTGGGTNFSGVFNDIDGPYHRGFDDNTPTDSGKDLPRWGGAITFNTATAWHFALDQVAGSGLVDFYSIALHELGHALGLASDWNQLPHNGAGGYTGASVLDEYNQANNTSATFLDLDSSDDFHWSDGSYDSPIFEYGDPNLVGTVGLGQPQDLLMEPEANLNSVQRRLELTNMDVAALRDVGWSVIPEPSSLSLLGLALAFSLRRRR
ncbi:PEP-CTERM sorting domain-containing protein [Roseibacillus persicicus]|uniref:PEP-CTERM sorting domain-containing protein n=1 Tax=Roseibacillus persicicus TaxID=454148 RepID=UPI00280FB2D0|nr:PEP-CTERM sorting domain-containing protein [Roseibacillus persicicus]MDQ8190435.1 PEP-CTERM sorting domain-containing protein [Roseibacillus persicicus]